MGRGLIVWVVAGLCWGQGESGLQNATITFAGNSAVSSSSVTFTGGLRATNASLASLVIIAYGLRPYQFSGPAWMQSRRFNIATPLPERTSRAQASTMLQRLLAEKFGLYTHEAEKEMPVYELTVSKEGSKLQPSAAAIPDGAGADVPGATPTRAPNAPPPRAGARVVIAIGGGEGRIAAAAEPMAELALQLEGVVHEPVIDSSGLNGRYAFDLRWPQTGGAAALAKALESQLGLRLEHKKTPVKILVVDHAEKQPR